MRRQVSSWSAAWGRRAGSIVRPDAMARTFGIARGDTSPRSSIESFRGDEAGHQPYLPFSHQQLGRRLNADCEEMRYRAGQCRRTDALGLLPTTGDFARKCFPEARSRCAAVRQRSGML
jgi:hypothetical protein